jgi:3D (Asp-Asp-Asp) domain-containing protein
MGLVAVVFCGAHAAAEAVTTPKEIPAPQPAVVEPVKLTKVVEIPEVIEPVVAAIEPTRIDLGEFKITHYCPCPKCCGEWADGITSTGTVATEGRTIAVDPSVIPYGSEVLLVYEDGTTATYLAEDCGGAIKGNRIDVFMDDHAAAWDAGVKYAEVFVNG